MRFFFHIAYQGQDYSGWQRQPDVKSVQEVLETTLSKILKVQTTIFGCGRTDAQVHASQYFFHADMEKECDFDLLYRLNKALPTNIAVYDIIKMDGKPHARFDAIHREYDYFIHTYKDPFLSNQSSLYLYPNLDLQKMSEAAKLLLKYKDFRPFCTHPDKNEHTLCQVSSTGIYVNTKGDRIRFNIASNRFLGKMIRIITGKLLKIAVGELSIDEFENHFITLEVPKILNPAYPVGLYLSKVKYPYLDLPPRTDFLSPTQSSDWLLI
ncbi:tRNA pseudouridine(38-40) synthase TruA [Sphingobacterium faecium]|uniref:tRNA pseudouridine(38-40) synthase TruA n=1 Tax=Sphingobacterium faecium TaxID=34087 RepID=UPI0021B5CEAE|nr:tRNA pseudouridine(38-40) synthase TruA [Sphingobacterium faecium]UXD71224.1 tRNA pseudouridine(38-40) synthase TruA [Sphingobacterium faecium]